jgi:hypothetical protein
VSGERWKKRKRARVAPADLRALESSAPRCATNCAHSWWTPCAELVDLVEHVGDEQASVVELALTRTAVRLLLPEQGLALRYAQTGDPEIASRLARGCCPRLALDEERDAT